MSERNKHRRAISISFFILCLIGSAGLFYLLHFPHGTIPPAGKLLNPFAGFWQNGEKLNHKPPTLVLAGLRDSVTVIWDDRLVPHIFAENEGDLYFAQGYVTASERLWQMEFQILAAAGRLSEVIGDELLEYDRFRRRIGMIPAARTALAEMLADPETKAAIESYSAGVNAYIDQLDEASRPLEYKLLDYRPRSWEPLGSALLLKQMAWNLTAYALDDLKLTVLRERLGQGETERLFPARPPRTTPIVPPEVKWHIEPPPIPKPPAPFTPRLPERTDHDPKMTARGSNNWVVAGKKTAHGYPLLCNDPHLGLNLPSVWFEIQLHSPSVNVYGVSLPGAPGVIIGFNDSIAWGLTNAETDVIDFYEIEFRDKSRLEYRYNDTWHPVDIRPERLLTREGDTIIDTVRWTHHGPVIYEWGEKRHWSTIPPGTAMRWTGHEPSNELKALLELNRGRNHTDYLAALNYFDCPAQNFVFAASSGDIAIVHNGRLPIRWPGQGRYIGDGRRASFDWDGFIPREHLPRAVNPDQGFLCSANQFPVDAGYPYYLDGNFAPYGRSGRINEMLASGDSLTPGDMIMMQQDCRNPLAAEVLPPMLARLDATGLSETEQTIIDSLESWKYRYQRDRVAPTVFESWWHRLQKNIWDDEFPGTEKSRFRPRRDITAGLIREDSTAACYDDKGTAPVESLTDLIEASFRETADALAESHGPFGPAWRWGRVRGADIHHLARIPGLGRTDLETDGHYDAINATYGTVGPSWRMVVELARPVRAWGILPGGQSGHPGSKYYDNGIADWIDGHIYELFFWSSPNEPGEGRLYRTTMRGER